MRRRLLLLVVLGAGLAAGPLLRAECPSSVPVRHALGSCFQGCDPANIGEHLIAYAYQMTDPAGTNSGLVPITREAFDIPSCVGEGGTLGPEITIEADWSSAGMAGCPTTPEGARRIVIVLSKGSFVFTHEPFGAPVRPETHPDPVPIGGALVVSLHAVDAFGQYLVEAAHPADLTALVCRQTVAVLSSRTETGAVAAAFSPVPVHTDCDPGSYGLPLGSCADGFVPDVRPGPVYYSLQPCQQNVDARRTAWVNTGVFPDASGRATVFIPDPAGVCRYVGSTVFVGGFETELVTGFSFVDATGCDDQDNDDFSPCAGDCDDRDRAVHPGAAESCNGIDDDCDGAIDEGPDADSDGVGDACDNCPFIPNPTQDPSACQCDLQPMVSFTSPLGRGSGTVSWSTCGELDLLGFNIIVLDNQGDRIQLNDVLIPCEQCLTGLGGTYSHAIPKHRSGKNIFVEVLHQSGITSLLGPAIRE